MIIDFEKIAEIHQEGFKGGKGLLDTRNYVDEKVRIMYSFLVSGTLTFHYDGQTEVCHAGQCHYCPVGHSHYMENLTDHDAIYFAVVPEHH